MTGYQVRGVVTHIVPDETGDDAKSTPIGIRLAGRQLVMSATNYEKYKEAMKPASKDRIGFGVCYEEIDLPGTFFTKYPGNKDLDTVWVMVTSGDNEKAVRTFLKDKFDLALT